jgi:aldehyde dehydrogenase (NAD+)
MNRNDMTAPEAVTNQIAAPAAPSVELNARAAARAESRMLIGGRLVESSSGERFDNVSPATGEVLGSTAAATPADMDAAIASARSAFDDTGWPTDIALRQRCLLQLQEALERESEHLREELVAEAGAPLMITHIAQLDWPLADGLRYPTGRLDSYQWERELPGGGFMGEMNHRVVRKEAVGVVAAIVPWNFPFEIALNKLGQALATGNTVVLKPDPNTPWTATRIGRLIAEETEMPPGVVNVVTAAENSVAQQVVTDPRIDMISFTGSTGVGKLIAAKAADTLKRVFLELGGSHARRRRPRCGHSQHGGRLSACRPGVRYQYPASGLTASTRRCREPADGDVRIAGTGRSCSPRHFPRPGHQSSPARPHPGLRGTGQRRGRRDHRRRSRAQGPSRIDLGRHLRTADNRCRS